MKSKIFTSYEVKQQQKIKQTKAAMKSAFAIQSTHPLTTIPQIKRAFVSKKEKRVNTYKVPSGDMQPFTSS